MVCVFQSPDPRWPLLMNSPPPRARVPCALQGLETERSCSKPNWEWRKMAWVANLRLLSQRLRPLNVKGLWLRATRLHGLGRARRDRIQQVPSYTGSTREMPLASKNFTSQEECKSAPAALPTTLAGRNLRRPLERCVERGQRPTTMISMGFTQSHEASTT